MQTVFNLLSNNEQSYSQAHFTKVLVNQNWVLVNKISEAKTIYVFQEDNTLVQKTNTTISKAKWHYVNENYIRITDEDGSINVIKMSFRDDDILTLDIDRKSNELAVFINESANEIGFNCYDDITDYLHDKYLNKAKNIIYNHQYYYINKSEEFGPFTAKQIIDKTNRGLLNNQCFIRETNDYDYSKRLRIIDLFDAI
ncbi:hypothetical protein [uncultured Lacinutrix sp.]|uniref:hypothetical protein n=1 Tax=uncultured Lacinutrix sp. TaxID=574032 RepID=UPI00262693AF|nr:hypothetical protein [uncultured Lacinutrix sp.]